MRWIFIFALLFASLPVSAQEKSVSVLIKGYNVPEVIFALESQTEKLKKDQFETVEEYEKRREDLLSKITVENPPRKLSEFVVVIGAQQMSGSVDIYDAESQNFRITAKAILPVNYGKQTNPHSKYKGASIGVNARMPIAYAGLDIRFHMPPSRAKVIAPRLQIAYFGLPESVRTYSGWVNNKYVVTSVGLHFPVKRIVCFDSETGEVYFDAPIKSP